MSHPCRYEYNLVVLPGVPGLDDETRHHKLKSSMHQVSRNTHVLERFRCITFTFLPFIMVHRYAPNNTISRFKFFWRALAYSWILRWVKTQRYRYCAPLGLNSLWRNTQRQGSVAVMLIGPGFSRRFLLKHKKMRHINLKVQCRCLPLTHAQGPNPVCALYGIAGFQPGLLIKNKHTTIN
jgi:hypothetical protein